MPKSVKGITKTYLKGDQRVVGVQSRELTYIVGEQGEDLTVQNTLAENIADLLKKAQKEADAILAEDEVKPKGRNL